MSSELVKEVWKDYWVKTRGQEIFLDEMSENILKELLNNCGGVKGKKILEAGCGRGVISAELAALGAEVYLLDISQDALDISRKYFDSKDLYACFTNGDILDLPYGESTFDIIWNAGVMEHFEEGPQTMILKDFSRIIRRGGLFITFNPFDGAFFYKLGKRAAERKGRWLYGPEFPVRTLKDKCEEAGLTFLREYQICFTENLSYFSYVSKPLWSIFKKLARLFPEKQLMKVFGGYLLVTVATKR